MVAPLVLAAVSAIGAGVAAVGVPIVKDIALRAAGKAAASHVLDKMGIPIDLDGPVNKETISAAICEKLFSGSLQFKNLFDKDAVKADVKRIVSERAAAQFGFDGAMSVDAVKQLLTSRVLQQVGEEMAAGAGEFIDVARDLQSSVAICLRKNYADYNTPKDFTPEGVSNRERQATYRGNHNKTWVAR